MFRRGFSFKVVPGETEHITFTGKRLRRPTVLIKVGSWSLSKRAFLLGAILALCQVLDGLLTYVGLSILGVHMEGNAFLRSLMLAYGTAPALFLVKSGAVILAVLLMFKAHQRRWVRPLITILILIYLALAVIPWTYIISSSQAAAREQTWSIFPQYPESFSLRGRLMSALHQHLEAARSVLPFS